MIHSDNGTVDIHKSISEFLLVQKNVPMLLDRVRESYKNL